MTLQFYLTLLWIYVLLYELKFETYTKKFLRYFHLELQQHKLNYFYKYLRRYRRRASISPFGAILCKNMFSLNLMITTNFFYLTDLVFFFPTTSLLRVIDTIHPKNVMENKQIKNFSFVITASYTLSV